MPRKRSRLIAVAVAAAAVPLAFAGYQAGATGTSDAKGDSAASTAPCLADATTLLGDLDGDGHADKIVNPGHSGTAMTVQWGSADGSFSEKHSVNELVGAEEAEIATAAVADFQNDGTLDLVVNLVEPSPGDDSETARLSEYRPGPLNRADLSSDNSRHLDIGDRGEAEELRIANYGDDEYPDLAILNAAGDGQLDRSVRLTEPGTGPGEFDREAMEEYGEWGARPQPPAMPTDGWKHFYKPCS
ncbi:VCBS repeat-containing protein [Streptomyces sp. P38-E01]|uniref:VCBS repeat-containing protein n=1 Tax=Streptomyces tardus TaxID=2780544 RepID=A0A949N2Y5_9ACTN|nr:VCBS repeat-containing protein [Streptomyces tardus]MBU7596284.1 VCBS repeat-containing protein [Streptomyces tardus]